MIARLINLFCLVQMMRNKSLAARIHLIAVGDEEDFYQEIKGQKYQIMLSVIFGSCSTISMLFLYVQWCRLGLNAEVTFNLVLQTLTTTFWASTLYHSRRMIKLLIAERVAYELDSVVR